MVSVGCFGVTHSRMCVRLHLSLCRCLQQIEEDGLSVDDIFRQTVFRQDERDMVLRAVCTARPDYQPSALSDQEVCSSPLVQEFYREVQRPM